MKKIYFLLALLWIFISVIFTAHLNLKGYVGNVNSTFFTSTGYNFEYKRGFPTPWYSRYYNVPADQLDKYRGDNNHVATPPHDYLIYTDASKPVFAGQIIMAAIPSMLLFIVLIRLKRS